VGLGSSATYYYKIQATNAGGNSSWSNEASAKTNTPPATIPVAPSNLIATATGTSVINLSWIDNAANETSYVLQRSLAAVSGFTTIATLAANTTSYSNTGLNSSTTYYFKVQAVNSVGNSAWSNVANATTSASGPPVVPTQLVAKSTGCSTINLTWIDNSSNETSFDLRRSTSLSGTYTTIATLPANAITYTNTGLTKGRKYYYKVRAVNAAGNSAFGNIANATASCITATKSGEFAEFAGTNPEVIAKSIKLYPNPSTDGWINLNFPAETQFPVTIRVFTVTGEKVLQKELFDYSNTIEITGLKSGMYILTIHSKKDIQYLKLQVSN
jgi:predicted phage tail protein